MTIKSPDKRKIHREYMKQYYIKNKAVLSAKAKIYRENNKEYIAEQMKIYAEKNKEILKQKRKERYAKNREAYLSRAVGHRAKLDKSKVSEYGKQYRKKNRESISLKRKQFRENNKPRIAEANKVWRESNREYLLKKGKEYYDANRESLVKRSLEYLKTPMGKIVAARHHHKRHTQMKESECSLTVDQWNKILALQDNRCTICKKRFTKRNPATKDHIIPLSKGGAFTFENIQAVHSLCNNKKRNKIDPTNIVSWLQ